MTKHLSRKEFNALSDEEKEKYLGKGRPFDRIRRVTGYLNPDYRRWNDGKQAELKDRVKHRMED